MRLKFSVHEKRNSGCRATAYGSVFLWHRSPKTVTVFGLLFLADPSAILGRMNVMLKKVRRALLFHILIKEE